MKLKTGAAVKVFCGPGRNRKNDAVYSLADTNYRISKAYYALVKD